MIEFYKKIHLNRQNKVLQLLKKNRKEVAINFLFKKYIDKYGNINYRTFQRLINKMSLEGYIKTKIDINTHFSCGKTTMIKLNR